MTNEAKVDVCLYYYSLQERERESSGDTYDCTFWLNREFHFGGLHYIVDIEIYNSSDFRWFFSLLLFLFLFIWVFPSHFSMCEIYNLYGHHVWSIHLSLSFFHWWKCSIGSSPHENKQIMSPLFAIFFCLKGVEKNGLFRNWIKIIQGALAS